jgi:hypothetical protein
MTGKMQIPLRGTPHSVPDNSRFQRPWCHHDDEKLDLLDDAVDLVRPTLAATRAVPVAPSRNPRLLYAVDEVSGKDFAIFAAIGDEHARTLH